MSAATGTLTVRTKLGERDEVFAWNGHPQDRLEAKRAFETAVKKGGVLAVAFAGTQVKEGTRVSTFEEVEKIEKEAGTVTVRVSPGLVGG